VGKVVEAQLTALADLSNEFPLRVLVPFLVRIEEYEYWLAFIRQRIPDHVPVGAMAETPASLLDVGPLVESADFVAIGCNDLMQGLYAADRDRADLRHYLDPYAPVLFRLFRQVAVQAGEHLHRIQLCGLLPQIQGVFPVLLGLGYRTFSVDTPFIPCSARTTLEVLKTLGQPGERHVPFLTR
jgi:phosphoenolpyruvate-protein kinase (PTS system EI component)